MKRSGLLWTIQEAILLYDLIKSGSTAGQAETIMGRSEKAFKYKVIDGGLYDNDLRPVTPFPSKISFIRTLKKKRKIVPVNIAPHLSSGKLSKIFKRINKQYNGIHSIPINKRHLVPLMDKRACKNKYDSAKAWWKFSSDAQSNPYMRSQTFKKTQGLCALCAAHLSEGEFQAHHSCYDHICSFEKTIYSVTQKQKKVRIPDCETCHQNRPDLFEQCLNRLHAVHGACNKKLYEAEG